MHLSEKLGILLSRLDRVRKIGANQWEAICPVHNDSHPSLWLMLGDKRIIVRCRSCGDIHQQAVEAVGLTLADLRPDDDRPDKPLPKAEWLRVQRENERRRQEQAAQEAKAIKDSIERATAIWNVGLPINIYPYNTAKRIGIHGGRLCRDGYQYYSAKHQKVITACRGWIMYPCATPDGVIHSIQFISPRQVPNKKGKLNWPKHNMTSCRMQGYFAIGAPTRRIFVAEGVADVASLYQETRLMSVAVFGVGRFLEVALLLIQTYPGALVIFVADNDPASIAAAKSAAADPRINGAFIVPPPEFKDFNDAINGGHRLIDPETDKGII